MALGSLIGILMGIFLAGLGALPGLLCMDCSPSGAADAEEYAPLIWMGLGSSLLSVAALVCASIWVLGDGDTKMPKAVAWLAAGHLLLAAFVRGIPGSLVMGLGAWMAARQSTPWVAAPSKWFVNCEVCGHTMRRTAGRSRGHSRRSPSVTPAVDAGSRG